MTLVRTRQNPLNSLKPVREIQISRLEISQRNDTIQKIIIFKLSVGFQR